MKTLLLAAAGAVVLIYCRRKKYITKTVFVLSIAMMFVSAGLIILEAGGGGLEEISEIDPEKGSEGDDVELFAVTGDGREHAVTVRIPESSYSEEEACTLLDTALSGMDAEVLGRNSSFEKIEWDLNFPTSFRDSDITCEWFTDDPDVLGTDGVIGTSVASGGQKVIITGELHLQDETREYERTARVYPSKEETALERGLQEEADELNKEKESDAYILPSSYRGQSVKWFTRREHKGALLCLLAVVTAVLSAVAGRKKKEKKEEKRQEKLHREYPELVSKLLLLTSAGLSLRKCMKRLGPDYCEVQKCWQDMENGVTEQEAYRRFGERCKAAEYKRLALLLAQSQKKGGQQFQMLLEQEKSEAFELRKRSARADGEKASVRMVLPMGMMLVVVLIVIMVPALISF